MPTVFRSKECLSPRHIPRTLPHREDSARALRGLGMQPRSLLQRPKLQIQPRRRTRRVELRDFLKIPPRKPQTSVVE